VSWHAIAKRCPSFPASSSGGDWISAQCPLLIAPCAG
jgi:hypothetical protein